MEFAAGMQVSFGAAQVGSEQGIKSIINPAQRASRSRRNRPHSSAGAAASAGQVDF
jgi:hypothetical protein